jgi:hypothetical protein
MNLMDNRTGVAVAIALGVVIPIAVAVILLWSGADRSQIGRGSTSVVRDKIFVGHQQK